MSSCMYKHEPEYVEAVMFDGSNISEVKEFVGDDVFGGHKLINCKNNMLKYAEKSAPTDTILSTIGLKIDGKFAVISTGAYVFRDAKGLHILSGEEFQSRYECIGTTVGNTSYDWKM